MLNLLLLSCASICRPTCSTLVTLGYPSLAMVQQKEVPSGNQNMAMENPLWMEMNGGFNRNITYGPFSTAMFDYCRVPMISMHSPNSSQASQTGGLSISSHIQPSWCPLAQTKKSQLGQVTWARGPSNLGDQQFIPNPKWQYKHIALYHKTICTYRISGYV